MSDQLRIVLINIEEAGEDACCDDGRLAGGGDGCAGVLRGVLPGVKGVSGIGWAAFWSVD